MRKLLFMILFASVTTFCFGKEASNTKLTAKKTVVNTKKSTKRNFKKKLAMDCFPVQINATCGTFIDNMCSAPEATPLERQAAFEHMTEMYNKAVCGSSVVH